MKIVSISSTILLKVGFLVVILKSEIIMQHSGYNIILSQASFEIMTSYKIALISRAIIPGAYLKALLDDFTKQGHTLDQISNTEFIELLLSTKKPLIFAESELKGDGSDWNRAEIQILGDISVTTLVDIYDNGVWSPSAAEFRTHVPPLKGELLFTPGPLLEEHVISPDFEEVVINGTINQGKYNQLIDRRLTPLLFHVNESAKKKNVSAVITLPGIGCGAFAGNFHGEMGEHLNRALKYIIEKNAKHFTNIACIHYDPFRECKNEEHKFNDVIYRVRPTVYNPNKSQLSHPTIFQENGDDFSKSNLYKIVAWDHVSFPGNDYYVGSRSTDDGVSAAATNSMEAITGLRGRYYNNRYMPPAGYIDWNQVVCDNNIKLQVRDNVNILTSDGLYVDLREFEENQH